MNPTQTTPAGAPTIGVNGSYAPTPATPTAHFIASRATVAVVAPKLAMLAGAAAIGSSFLSVLVLLVSDSETGFKIALSLFVLGVGVGVGAAGIVGGVLLERAS